MKPLRSEFIKQDICVPGYENCRNQLFYWHHNGLLKYELGNAQIRQVLFK